MKTRQPDAAAVPVAVENLTVRYGRTAVLEDVTLRLPRGTVYALLGRNGAGKSSLVGCVVGRGRRLARRAIRPEGEP